MITKRWISLVKTKIKVFYFMNITIVAHLNAFHAQGLGKEAA